MTTDASAPKMYACDPLRTLIYVLLRDELTVAALDRLLRAAADLEAYELHGADVTLRKARSEIWYPYQHLAAHAEDIARLLRGQREPP